MTTPSTIAPLTTAGRYLVLTTAFFGWFFAGVHMSITQLTGREAAIDLLSRNGKLDLERYQELSRLDRKTISPQHKAELEELNAPVGRWFAWFQCAFLFGAASGGWCFGKLGDRIGRAKAMAFSILTYSVMSAAVLLAQSVEQWCILWFLACMGVGGMWPNGVALVSEVWSSMSRPAVAGVIGTSANIGIFLMATLAAHVKVTTDNWHWPFLVGSGPVVLGLFALVAVPESPRWLAARQAPETGGTTAPTTEGVFQPPLLGITLMAIVLATIPMIGGWGTANWMNPWSAQAGESANPPDPHLKGRVLQVRALPGIIGSLLGGWIASMFGRRLTYFTVSLTSLALAQYIFWFCYPTDPLFLVWVGTLGFISGIYFGWLPLCLPEMFPTRVRSTGAGVGFNFGRIITAVTIFIAGALMTFFGGDYAKIGRATSLLFLIGMVAIWFTPDTSEKQLSD